MLREARASLPTRCQELIHMLFYEEPKRPYQQVAESLGLATGSIGLLRQKCLDSLRDSARRTRFFVSSQAPTTCLTPALLSALSSLTTTTSATPFSGSTISCATNWFWS